jgi:hypothetical protein
VELVSENHIKDSQQNRAHQEDGAEKARPSVEATAPEISRRTKIIDRHDAFSLWAATEGTLPDCSWFLN